MLTIKSGILILLGIVIVSILWIGFHQTQAKMLFKCEGSQSPNNSTARQATSLGILYNATGVSENALINAGCPIQDIVNITNS